MNTKSLAFARMEDGATTTVGVVLVDTVIEGMSDRETFERLRGAVTDWVAQTKEGKEAWERSSRDFNVGDLEGYYQSPILAGFLGRRGMSHLRLVVVDPSTRAIGYDENLVNEDELP